MQDKVEKVKISIIIAVYNAEKYLKQCLDSLLKQTFSKFEVICVNDGSTDGSLAVLEQYQRRDERIRVYTQSNQYAGVARNNGLKYAKGEYCLFLDADDFLESDSLEILFCTATEKQADIVVFGYYKYDTKSRQIIEDEHVVQSLEWFGDGIKNSGEIAPFIFNFSSPCAWNKFYRTMFIRKSGISFMPLKSTNDLFFSYMTLGLAERICICSKLLIYYRVNNANSLQEMNRKTSIDFLLAISELKNKLLVFHIFEKFETSFNNMTISVCYYHFYCYQERGEVKRFYEEVRPYMQQNVWQEGYVPNEYTDMYAYYEMHKIMNLNYEAYVEFEDAEKQISYPYYYFPFWILPKGKNVVIYGAGNVGKSYYFQLSRMQYCNSLKMTDSFYKTMHNNDVTSLETAFSGKIDYVIIAVADFNVKEKIEQQLKDSGYKFKILWQEVIRKW